MNIQEEKDTEIPKIQTRKVHKEDSKIEMISYFKRLKVNIHQTGNKENLSFRTRVATNNRTGS